LTKWRSLGGWVGCSVFGSAFTATAGDFFFQISMENGAKAQIGSKSPRTAETRFHSKPLRTWKKKTTIQAQMATPHAKAGAIADQRLAWGAPCLSGERPRFPGGKEWKFILARPQGKMAACKKHSAIARQRRVCKGK
jgi:hypothetical protein